MSASPQAGRYYEKYWAEGSEVYSGEQQGYAENFRRWMARELAGVARARILEAGCGDGTFTQNLAAFGSVTAVDISAGQLERNARRFPQIRFQQQDLAEPLPFAEGEFDVIWCSEVLEHLFDPLYALREMRRVLAPNGRLLVTVPYHGRLKNVMIALCRWESHFAPTGPHLPFFTKKSLAGVAGKAGFERIHLRTCGMGRPWRDALVATNILMRAQK